VTTAGAPAFASLRSAARAYPTLLRVGFAEALAYRAEMLVWMLTTTMPLVSLALWSAVADGGPVGRFDQAAFTRYFLATLVVRQLSGCWLVWQLNQDIRSGALSRRLLRPVHPLVTYSAENLAALPLRAAISLPIAIALLVSTRGGAPSLSAVAIGAASILGAWLLNFFSMAIVGALAFFLESSTAIFEAWLVLFMVLSGYLFPLELFPAWARDVAFALPFRFGIGFPVEVLNGLSTGADALRGLALQYAYVAGFAVVGIVLFRVGTRRFVAFGG
jgi:ABC-2 type transport system permease protein